MRKLPGSVGGLNAKQDMLSSGGDVTSISYKGQNKICHILKLWTELLLLLQNEWVGPAVIHEHTQQHRGLTHVPSSGCGYLLWCCRTCWYPRYQTPTSIRTDSSLPCERVKGWALQGPQACPGRLTAGTTPARPWEAPRDIQIYKIK